MSAKKQNGFQKLRRWLGRPRLVKQTHAIILQEKEQCENPIFLIGCHRSGTSLVRRIFNSHRNIACPPETYFLQHYVEMLKNPKVSSGYLGFGYDEKAMQKELRCQARRLHEAFRIAQGKRRWADKTPQYFEILDGLFDLFGPDVRFVMIYRDPFDVAASLFEKKWRHYGKYEDLFSDTLEYVAYAQKTQREFEARHDKLCTRLHYERLNENPEAELKGVLSFLREDWDPDMLKFSEKPHNFGIEDLIVRSSQSFEPSTGKWRAWTPKQIAEARDRLAKSASALGYELPTD